MNSRPREPRRVSSTAEKWRSPGQRRGFPPPCIGDQNPGGKRPKLHRVNPMEGDKIPGYKTAQASKGVMPPPLRLKKMGNFGKENEYG